MSARSWPGSSNYTLSVIPLFILMGVLAERAGLSQGLFTCADALT